MIEQFLASTFRISTPLILAALGGLLSERAGITNIALEGLMLAGAFAAAVVALSADSPWAGLASGMAAGGGLALLYGLVVIKGKANQIIAGMAINLLAYGLTPFLCKLLYGVTGTTPAVAQGARLQFGVIWIALAVLPLIWLFLNRTRPGLWLSFAGENPAALESAGVRVERVRWLAVWLSGLLAGCAGATLSIALSSSFSRGMTAGRGFIALAALIFGKWKPIPTALGCLLFGFAEAAQIRLQAGGRLGVPPQLVQVLPYVLTLIVLAGLVGKARPPKALGR